MKSILAEQTLQKLPKNWVKQGLYGYEVLRSLAFLSQNLSLPLFEKILTGKLSRPLDREFTQNLKVIYQDLLKCLQEDSQDIADGYFPVAVLKPESPKDFWLRFPLILKDGIEISRRRKNKSAHEFPPEALEDLKEAPEYFQRNFHFQTGGYLTEQSARLYEHQVEILFAGAADAMRRLILKPLKQHFGSSDGEGLHFLEVACGTGRLSKFVKLAFPKAQLTVLDLSGPYLKQAQRSLKGFKKINFVQGDGADLPFKDQRFDAVFSCFLFHELPLSVRQQVLGESHRVAKSGAFIGLVDSLQLEDKKDFEWALKQFAVDFHEPFYKNYLQNPMEGLLASSGVEGIQSRIGFFSKAVFGVKP